MMSWTVQTDRALGSLLVRRHAEHPADRFEEHGDWRVFLSGEEVVGARHDRAFHGHLDLTPLSGSLPANVIAELRRVADDAQGMSGDITHSLHTA